jgi:hypothetical protein
MIASQRSSATRPPRKRMAESSEGLARRFLAQPGAPDARVKRCLEVIRRALEEHDCELQVSIHFNGTGQSAPEIRVMPSPPSSGSGN